MENKLLKQSDIDSLVSELAAQAAAEPPPPPPPELKAEPAVPATPPAAPAAAHPTQSASLKTPDAEAPPAVKQVSLEDARRQAPSQEAESSYEKLVSLNEKLMDRLRRVESKVQKLEQIEKVRTGGGIDLVTTQQLQEVMAYVQQINQEMADMSNRLQGTLGYDIFHSFQCSKCGARERVASIFRCTSCGQETWRGW